MCILCTPRPIDRSTYRPTLDRCIGRHIGRVSVDMSTDISVESRSICRPRCVGRHIDRCISAEWWSTYRLRYLPIVGRYSGRHSADTLTIDCRRSIGRQSVVYRSSVSYNVSKKLRLSVTGVNKAVASGGEKGAVATPPPPPKKKKMNQYFEQNFLFLKYRAENQKFAEITLLSLLQNAYVGNEYTLSIMKPRHTTNCNNFV